MRIHGHARDGLVTPEYRAWKNMLERCYTRGHHRFGTYGARGIRVCGRWRKSFVAFLADVGTRPSSRHSLDRIDNDGDYQLDNVRWATAKQQARNRSNNRKISLNGRTLTVPEWAEETGLVAQTIYSRIYRGCTPAQALAVGG